MSVEIIAISRLHCLSCSILNFKQVSEPYQNVGSHYMFIPQLQIMLPEAIAIVMAPTDNSR